MKNTATQAELNANDAKAWTGDIKPAKSVKIDTKALKNAYKRKTFMQKLIELLGA